MPGAARIGDIAACPMDSHGCQACFHGVKGPVAQGSKNVSINGKPAAHVGCRGIHGVCCGTNTFTIADGAPSVFINGYRAARIGDRTAHCGGSGEIKTGSSDVIIGDGQARLFKEAAKTQAPFVDNIAANRKRSREIWRQNMEYLNEKGISWADDSSKVPELGTPAAPPSVLEFINGKKPGIVDTWGKGEFTQNAELWAHDLNPDEKAYLDHFNLKRIDSNNLTDEQIERATELFGNHPSKNILYANWRSRARILNHYKYTHPATIRLFKHSYRTARDLNPATWAFERGYQIGSGQEMFTGDKVSRAGAGAEVLLAIILLKGMGKLSRLGADDSLDDLTAVERNMVDDLARQLTNDIEKSQAAMGRAVETKNLLPKTKLYKNKVVASDGCTTLSGWDGKTTSAPSEFSRVTPEEIRAYSAKIGHNLEPTKGLDVNPFTQKGFAGKYNASHAEKQMTILSPNKPIGVSKEMCDDCIQFFSKQAQYTGKTQVVTDPEVTRIFMPDGSIKEISLPK